MSLSPRGDSQTQVTHVKVFGLVLLVQSQDDNFTKHPGTQPSQFTLKLHPDEHHDQKGEVKR